MKKRLQLDQCCSCYREPVSSVLATRRLLPLKLKRESKIENNNGKRNIGWSKLSVWKAAILSFYIDLINIYV